MTAKMIMMLLSFYSSAPVPTGQGWQKDNNVTVSFVQDPNTVCGPIEGWTIFACVDEIGGNHMTLPNPCPFKDYDAYARLACHELGHTNYWRHEYK